MSNSNPPKDGDFAQWVDEKSAALKFELGEKFPIPQRHCNHLQCTSKPVSKSLKKF